MRFANLKMEMNSAGVLGCNKEMETIERLISHAGARSIEGLSRCIHAGLM